jgi:hypothetical protein
MNIQGLHIYYSLPDSPSYKSDIDWLLHYTAIEIALSKYIEVLHTHSIGFVYFIQISWL